MSWAERLNDKLEASKQKNLAGIREREGKKAQLRAEMHKNSAKMAESKQEIADIGSELKQGYKKMRDDINTGIAANHGKKPADDGVVVNTASLGIRIVKLFFAGIFLVAFIYILVNMIF